MIYMKRLLPIEVVSSWYQLGRTIHRAEGATVEKTFKLEGIEGTINNAYIVANISKAGPYPTIPMDEHYISITKDETTEQIDIQHDPDDFTVVSGYTAFDFSNVIDGNGEYTIRVHQREETGKQFYQFLPIPLRPGEVPDMDFSDYYPAGQETGLILVNIGTQNSISTTVTLTDMVVAVATGADEITVGPDGKINTKIESGGICADGICLFDAGETEFNGNGFAMLHPNSCVVQETAGSDYSLSMEYPLADERWKEIMPGRLIRVPVPVTDTPEFVLADSSFWRVKTKCSIYVKPTVSYTSYKTVTSTNADLNTTKDNDTGTTNEMKVSSDTTQTVSTASYSGIVPEYDPGAVYIAGMVVSKGGKMWKAKYQSYNFDVYPEPTNGKDWEYVGPVPVVYDVTEYPSAEKKELVAYTVATQTVADLEVDDVVMVISTVNQFWNQVRVTKDNRFITGYVKTEWLEEYTGETTESNIVGARHITHQVFRITNVNIDTAGGVMTVDAMHKSYDMQKTMLSGCKLENISPAVAIAVIQSSQMITGDNRLIATNITSDRETTGDALNNVTGDWGWDNALAAFIDSDNGLVPQLHAKLVRDNDDIFLLKNEVSETPKFTFSAGTNLHGVTWSIDDSDVVTRIIPTYEDKNGNTRLLPEIYVDADNANEFSEYRCEVFDTGLKIGEYTIINGQSVLFDVGGTYGRGRQPSGGEVTSETMREIVRNRARARFDIDKANLIKHSVEIDFTMLGDTEEYAPLKALGEARLYDTVRVKIPEIGLDINTQVDGYEWDCTNPRKPFLRSLTLMDVYRKNDWPVSGIRLKKGSVKIDKLSRTAKEEIKYYSRSAVSDGVQAAIKASKEYTDSRVENL